MGFRDSCQDLLGFVHLIPDRARERILDIAATQFEDGSCLPPVSAADQKVATWTLAAALTTTRCG